MRLNRVCVESSLALLLLAVRVPVRAQPKGLQRIAAPERVSAVGLTLEQALARPDGTILVGANGKQITVGELRKRKLLRDQHVASLSTKPPFKGNVARLKSPEAEKALNPIVQSLASENSTAMSLHQAALSRKTSAPAAAGAGNRLSDVLKPHLATVNGKSRGFHVFPGGYLTFEGAGFGDVIGQANVIGRFPGGAAALRVVDWKNTMVYALLPEGIRGVPDHDVNVQLITHDGKTFRLDGGKFVATRAEIEVTTNLTRIFRHLPAGFAAHMGDDGRVDRLDSREVNLCFAPSTDKLEVLKPPPGFVISGVGAWWGRTDSGDKDEYGEDGSRTFTPKYDLRWDSSGMALWVDWGVWRSHTSPDVLLSGWDHCASNYQIEVYLTGPAGVSPF